jgi:DNA-binding NarL/FixJ family response regulator
VPFLNGLDAAERLKPLLPKAKFVFLTMKDDPNLAAAALNLGAVGYVLKHSAVSELLTAVSEVLQGRPYVTAKLQAENWADREARAQQLSEELTPRQKEVLQLLAESSSDEGDSRHSKCQRENGYVPQVSHDENVSKATQTSSCSRSSTTDFL